MVLQARYDFPVFFFFESDLMIIFVAPVRAKVAPE
jgi:hypothetical protein